MNWVIGFLLFGSLFTDTIHGLPVPLQVALRTALATSKESLGKLVQLDADYNKFRSLLRHASAKADFIYKVDELKGKICGTVDRLSPPHMLSSACWDWLAADMFEVLVQVDGNATFSSKNATFDEAMDVFMDAIKKMENFRVKSSTGLNPVDYLFCRFFAMQNIIYYLKEQGFRGDSRVFHDLLFVEQSAFKVLHFKFNKVIKQMIEKNDDLNVCSSGDSSGQVTVDAQTRKAYTTAMWSIGTLNGSIDNLKMAISEKHRQMALEPVKTINYTINPSVPLKGLSERPVDIVMMQFLAQRPIKARTFHTHFSRMVITFSKRYIFDKIYSLTFEGRTEGKAVKRGNLMASPQKKESAVNASHRLFHASLSRKLSNRAFLLVTWLPQLIMTRNWR